MTESPRPRPATLKDIATAIGVDISTASKVVNGGGISVRPETRKAILDEAARLNYRPHALARNLRTRRTGAIGVLLPDLTNPIYAATIRGAVRRAEALGYVTLVAEAQDDAASASIYGKLVAERRIDGFIIAVAAQKDLIAAIDAQPVPHVFVNRRMVRDRTITHAIQQAYSVATIKERSPEVHLFLDIAPERVDVNVHPSKAEVRFLDQGLVHEILRRAVVDALGATGAPELVLQAPAPGSAPVVPGALPLSFESASAAGGEPGAFDSAAETLPWNTLITKPMMVTNTYISRSSRLGWFTGGPTQPDVVLNPLTFTNPGNAVSTYLIGGIAMTGATTTNSMTEAVVYPDTMVDIRGTSLITDPVVAGGTVIASSASQANSTFIASWPALSTSWAMVSSSTASMIASAWGRSSRTTNSTPLLRNAISRSRDVIVSRL